MSDNQEIYPKDWPLRRLEDIAFHITSGGTPTSGNARFYSESGQYLFAKTEDLTASKTKYLEHCELKITESALRESSAKIYPVGTILISMYGTIGLTKITRCELAANQALCALMPPFNCDPNYLYQHLEFIRPDWLRFSGQTTQANISGGIVRVREVPLPAISEQKQIAQILDTIDTAIQQTQAIINKLKQLKQGLLHDLLTRGVDAKGELRPCYEDAPHLYKESPLGWIPKDWEVCRVANLIVGIDAGKSPNCQDVPACGDQWGVLKVGAVHPDGLKLHENKVIEEEIFKKSNYLVRNGDLLFSRANTLDLVGFVCHVINSPKFLMLSDKTLRLTVKPSHMITRFLFWHFQHPEVRAQIEIGATGTSGSMKNISQSSIENILVCRPQINEQEKITQRLDNAVNNHKAEIENLLKMQSLKTALMDDLLTGRIRVTSLLQTEASSV